MILAITNQKGGVGKTTTAINLGAYLAAQGRRVLLVDVDPQANATSGLGVDRPGAGTPSVYDVLLGGVLIEQAIVLTDQVGLDLVPSTAALAGAEVELVALPDRERRLRRALGSIGQAYDEVLIDCPPSLGLLTVNALVAADGVVVPVQCEYLALEGLGQLLGSIDLIRRGLNPPLRIVGLVLTMFDPRTNLAQQVVAEVRSHFAETFRTVIPRSVRLSEAPSYGQSILAYDPHSKGAQAYAALAEELASRSGSAGRRS